MNAALIVLLSLSLVLSGCGGEKRATTNAPQAKATQKQPDHHDHDHSEDADGRDINPADKHEEPTPTKDGHAQEGHEENKEEKISLTAAQIKAAGIELAKVGPANIRETLPLYGVVAPNAERMREVAARFPGSIQRIDKKIGDAVREGETLALVESNESLQTYAVKAPLSGIVTARNANAGEQAADKPLFTIADLSTVWVELSLFPRDAAKVRLGQTVRIANTDANLSAEGTIAYVAPLGSSASQTITARVLLNNSEHRWTPGLYVTAAVTLSEQRVALAIRNDAVQIIESRPAVFVQEANGFEAHPVRLGRSDGDYSEVIEGLTAGVTYVTVNSFVLKAELTKGEAEHEH